MNRIKRIMKTTEPTLAGLTALLTTSLLSVAAYLAIVAPMTISIWKEEERALSAIAKLTVNASHICTSLGLFIFPILLLVFLGSIVWLILALKGKSDDT